MTRVLFILIGFPIIYGCTSDKYRNTVLRETNNVAHKSKATLFIKDGEVSVLKYNVSILNDDYTLTNDDTANVFSFTDTDTSHLNKNNNIIISMMWIGKTELEIAHPQIGTVWKNDSVINVDGITYHISYRIK